MKENNLNDTLAYEKIDFNILFKILLSSKKLILFATLFITFAGLIYSLQKEASYQSTALVEIGNFNFNSSQYQIIESPKSLITEVKIRFFYKENNDFNSNSFDLNILQERLLELNYKSTLPETNIKALNRVIKFIDERHSLLLSNKLENNKAEITRKINKLASEIEFYGNEDSLQKENQKKELIRRINELTNEIDLSIELFKIENKEKRFRINSQIPEIDEKIEALEIIISADSKNLELLKTNPKYLIERAAQSPTLNQVIYTYQDKLIGLKNEKINLLQEKNVLENEFKKLEKGFHNDMVVKLSSRKNSLESDLRILENNPIISERVFLLNQEKDELVANLELLLNNELTNKTQLVGEIVTSEVGIKTAIFLIYCSIFGFVFGSLIVLLKNDVIRKV